MKTKKKGLNIDLTVGQYQHLYNIMCSQEQIIDTLNESDDFDVQTLTIYLMLFVTLRRLTYHENNYTN